VWGAVLDGGWKAHASHQTAAWLWGWGEAPDTIEVTSTTNRKRDSEGYVLHRSKFDDGVTKRHRLPTSSPLRVLAELGATLPRSSVESCLDEFLNRKHVSINAVVGWRTAHAGKGRRGVGVLGQILEDRLLDGAMTDSQLEAQFARLLARHRIDGFELHRRVRAGKKSFEVDFAHVASKVAVELDGFGYHGNRVAFERDRRRDVELAIAIAGWVVLRFTWRDIVDRPDAVVQQILAVLASRQAA
jgi:very-short-patch-repair endonuclease